MSKQAIGGVIFAIPLVGIFVLAVHDFGWLIATTVAAGFICLAVGLQLLASPRS